MAETIGFGELVGLMVHGTGEPDRLRGVVHEVEDRRSTGYRCWRRGDFTRREDLDGTVLDIVGPAAHWHREPGSGQLWVHPHEQDVHRLNATSPIGGLDVGGPRPSWQRWEGTDFTRPTGPVRPVEFLGRRAYSLELAPPGHKPYPMQLIVDAGTGLVLRKANVAFGLVQEWTELDVDVDLPDDLFEWSGPSRTLPTRQERQAEWQEETRARRDWLTSRGVRLSLRMAADVRVHEWDDADGSFYASVEIQLGGTLLRRPRSTAPWSAVETTNYPHERRWTDERWDWFLASDRPLDDAEFADLQQRLASST